MVGERIGVFESVPEVGLLHELMTEPPCLTGVGPLAEILQDRKCRAPTLKLRDVSPADACPIAGEVYMRNRRASLGRPLRQPLALEWIEYEAAASKIGKLSLAAQSE